MKSMRNAVALLALTVACVVSPVQAITNPDKPIVKVAEAPWVVSLWRQDAQYDRVADGFSCTGTLINAYTIITAAHCMDSVADADSWGFVRGQYKKSNRGEVLLPSGFTIHPDYNRTNFLNDIAIVSLYFPATSPSYLRLPTASQSKAWLKKSPTIYGWGQLSNWSSSNYLRKAALKEMTAAAIKAFPSFDVTRQISAGRVNKNKTFTGACYGDSGGPLMGGSKNYKFLLGVVSYGAVGGCSAKQPTVYTRVSTYVPWIKSEMAVFVADRIERNIDIYGMKFEGTPASPLPTSIDQLGDGTWYRTTTAYLLTEDMELQSTDIAQLNVFSYAESDDYYEIEVQVVGKEPWSNDGCGLSNQYDAVNDIPASLTMYIRGKNNWDSALQLTYTAQPNDCISAQGNSLEVESLDGSEISSECDASIFINNDGSHSIAFDRSCLAGRTNLYIRTVMSISTTGDIEPGSDMWAGPFSVTQIT